MKTESLIEISPEQVELSLRALRQSYQRLIEDFEKFSEYARIQLSQVDSLLSVSVYKRQRVNGSAIKVKVEEPISPQKIVTGKGKRRNSNLKVKNFYDRFTMHEAIAYILDQCQGKSIDATAIVQELYGKNLTENDFKIAKDRVTKSLSKGKQEGKWYRVPDQSGTYTTSLEH